MKQNKPSFGNGIRCYSEALGFMFKHNLWHYFLYPLILNIGLFFIGFQLIDMLNENLNNWIADYFGAKGENLSWFKSALNSLLYISKSCFIISAIKISWNVSICLVCLEEFSFWDNGSLSD